MNSEIEEMERKIRGTIRKNSMSPALASLANQGPSGTELSEEFANAVNTLTSRAHKEKGSGSNITDPMTVWL